MPIPRKRPRQPTGPHPENAWALRLGRFLPVAARPAEDVVALPVIPVSRVAACE